jgi:hypothetical protein
MELECLYAVYKIPSHGGGSGGVCMRNFVRVFAVLFLVGGALALTPGAANAQHWHGHGGGHWRGGGWGPGFGFGYGLANPYYYGGGPYYAYDQGPNCGWVRYRRGYRRWQCW